MHDNAQTHIPDFDSANYFVTESKSRKDDAKEPASSKGDAKADAKSGSAADSAAANDGKDGKDGKPADKGGDKGGDKGPASILRKRRRSSMGQAFASLFSGKKDKDKGDKGDKEKQAEASPASGSPMDNASPDSKNSGESLSVPSTPGGDAGGSGSGSSSRARSPSPAPGTATPRAASPMSRSGWSLVPMLRAH
jgi:hypothetical protein